MFAHRVGTAKAVLNLLALITPEPSKDVLGSLGTEGFRTARLSDPVGDLPVSHPEIPLVDFMVEGLRHYDARFMARYDLQGIPEEAVEYVFTSTEMLFMETAYTGRCLNPVLRACFSDWYGAQEGDRHYTHLVDGLVNGFYTDQPCPFGRARAIMQAVLTNDGRFEPEVQWTLPFLPDSERLPTPSLTPTPTTNSLRQAA